MPPKGKSKITPKQRARIALGVVSGETHAQTARATGLTKKGVDGAAIDPRTKSLIVELKRRHSAKISDMFADSLKTIKYYIGNERTRKREDGSLALRASAQALNIVVAGEQKLDTEKSTQGDYTFQELLETYLAVKRERDAAKAAEA